MRGAINGLNAEPPERLNRVATRFADLYDPYGHWTEKKDYAIGYLVGLGKGLLTSLEGLWDAIVMIIKLPGNVLEFLQQTLPELAAKYGPRLLKAMTGGSVGDLRVFRAFAEQGADGQVQAGAGGGAAHEVGDLQGRDAGEDVDADVVLGPVVHR